MDKKTAHKIATASAKMAAKVAYRATMTKLAQVGMPATPEGAARVAPEGPTAGVMQAVPSDPGQILGRLQQIRPTGGQGKALEFFQGLTGGTLPPTDSMEYHYLANEAYHELQNAYSEQAGARLGLSPAQVQSGQQLITQQAQTATASFTRQPPAFHRVASLQKTASKLEAKTKTSKLLAVAKKFERQLQKRK
jgi:hypothetical protein